MRTSLRVPRLPILAASVLMLSPASSFAQGAPQGPPPESQKVAAAEAQAKPNRRFFAALFHNLADDLKHVPRRNSLYFAAGGGALALAIHPFDDNLNRHFAGDNAEALYKPGKYIGSFPFMLGSSIATYVVGHATDHPHLQHMGMDLIEATVLSEGITQLIKSSVRRERPLRADGTRASGFAFPSGHSAVTFAAATVFQQHLGRKAAIPTYLVATYVATSRLHENVHFASDVVFGAAEGIIIGRSVTWHGRNFYASPMLLPKGMGINVSVKR